MTDSNFSTHDVFNQSPLFGGHNAYANNTLLKIITRDMGQEIKSGLNSHGAWAGHSDTLALARQANQQLPVLNAFDAKGSRIDRVEYHPSYHAFMRRSVSLGLHSSIWDDNALEAGQRNTVRAARFYISSGVESGHLCPITMTNASVAALMESPELLGEWLPRIKSDKYDPTHKPPVQKTGLTIGMGMTEKQGGTDVRAATTTAESAGDGLWLITGHKWFMSAPMCDAFLVLAQTEKGLSCFLMPRILPDGSNNGIRIQRLKEKLGNRSNASSEVEFHRALGNLVGEEGRGIRTILEMVTLTRLDCAVSSAGLMHASLAEAAHHCRHRNVFGKLLIEQPVMVRVLADMALDGAGATALSMRLAHSYDQAATDEDSAAYARLMTPVIKYWVCKTAPSMIYEAMECLGGNGYVDDSNLARHYREAPLNAIWGGSGNVMCLDVMRVISSGGEIIHRVLAMLERDLGGPSAAKTVDVIRSAASMAIEDVGSARILTEQLALTAAAAELNRLGLGAIADAYTETRLGGLWRTTYGMIDNRYNAKGIVDGLLLAG